MKTIILATLSLITIAAWAQAPIFEKARPEDVPAGIVYSAEQPPVADAHSLDGKRVGIVAAHGAQESELVFPYEFLTARGATVEILVPSWSADRILLVQYVKPTLWVKATRTFTQARSEQYDLLVVPGGEWSSTVVRNDREAIQLIQRHFAAGKPLAAICSGTQALIDAGLARGRRLTGTHTAEVDLRNAGAHYVDLPVVVEENLITSRNPDDLIPFTAALEAALQR